MTKDLLDINAFGKWKDGETIYAVDYEKEREMMILATNHLNKTKLSEDGDFKGTINGMPIEEIGDAVLSARIGAMEPLVAEADKVTVTLKRGENVIDAPEDTSIIPVKILGDEVKNKASALDSGRWVLAPAVTVNSAAKATLNATGGVNHPSYEIISVLPNTDYTYQMKNSGGELAVFNGAGTSAIKDYTEGQSVKFNSGANTTVRIYFRNKNGQDGVFTFEEPMLIEGSTEREYVLGYQPVRGAFIEVDNGSYLYSGDYLYKGDELYQTDNGEWRKKQNKIEAFLTPENAKTVSVIHYTGGKGLNFKTAEILPSADLVVQEVLNWNGMYFARTDSKSNTTNNRYYLDETDFILFVSQLDTGWEDKPATPPAGYVEVPSKVEAMAFILGWKTAHNDGTVPYKDADKGTRGVRKWVRIVGAGESKTIPQDSYFEWKPFKTVYKTATTQDVPAKYEGELRLVKGTNKVTLGEGLVLREKANPILSVNNYVIGDPAVKGSETKYKIGSIIDVYRQGKKDVWVLSTNARLAKAQFDPLTIYTITYKVLDRYTFSCYVGDVEAKHTTNFHMEAREQVKSIQEIKNTLARIGLTVIDRLGKKGGVGLLGADGYPLQADGTGAKAKKETIAHLRQQLPTLNTITNKEYIHTVSFVDKLKNIKNVENVRLKVNLNTSTSAVFPPPDGNGIIDMAVPYFYYYVDKDLAVNNLYNSEGVEYQKEIRYPILNIPVKPIGEDMIMPGRIVFPVTYQYWTARNVVFDFYNLTLTIRLVTSTSTSYNTTGYLSVIMEVEGY